METAGVARWAFGKNGTAETGSDIGSDFCIRGYTDAGGLSGDFLTVARATGNSTFTAKIITTSAADGAITTSGKITAKAAVPASFADLAAVRTYLASILT